MLKKLTGKNQKDYEYAAKYILDNADEKIFQELVCQEDYLFDFVKSNVCSRLKNAVDDNNWKSVLKFLKYYSPFYEDFIVSTLVKYSDEDLTDNLLELLESGCDNEKTYCAKYFSYVRDSLAIEFLKNNIYTENEELNANCASTLGIFQDKTSYNEALEKLKNSDDFEKLSVVKFLINYGDKNVLPDLIEAMKTSSMSENIAGEIPYLINLYDILQEDFENGLLVLNNIINGLGEIIPLLCVFDYELYNIFEYLKEKLDDSKVCVVLLNSREQFETLTENDEYLFDEDKNVKNEIFDIKNLLNGINKKQMLANIKNELREDSPFIYTALNFADDVELIRELLKCNNQTIILKTAEVLKSLNNFNDTAKTVALIKITDENIKNIIRAL